MERFLKPERFDTLPESPGSTKSWNHWLRTFNNFISSIQLPNQQVPDKLLLLTNFLSPAVYDFISESTEFDSAIAVLNALYVKPANEVFARHVLATTKQEPGQPLDQFLQKLKTLSKECDFRAVSAEENRDAAVRDAFIGGLNSNHIRQRLLEKSSLNLTAAFDLARSLEMAEKQSQTFFTQTVAAVPTTPVDKPAVGSCQQNASKLQPTSFNPCQNELCAAASNSNPNNCFFCGYARHHRSKCPALNAICKGCGKKGHFQKVCQSRNKANSGHTSASVLSDLSPINAAISAAAPSSLAKSLITLTIGKTVAKALVDTGSSESYVSPELVQKLGLKQLHSVKSISMASTKHTTKTLGHVFTNFQYNNITYEKIKLNILPELCADILLGHDFLEQHECVKIPFQGTLPTLSVCGLAAAKVDTPSLFANLKPNCKPIATKSRRFSQPDNHFIREEVQKLLKEDIIETSNSPWRAQVVVTKDERHKKRLVVDYSQTINLYTELDAYPLPRIDEMVEKISEYEFFSTLDLKDAYHQVKIKDCDKPYTAFEADGNLYQFKRIPFGVTNGVACFQRIINNVIRDNKLKDSFAYLDNVTICGHSQAEHDTNLKNLRECARKHGIIFNDKGDISKREIDLIGYRVSKGNVKPDPERMEPLRKMPPPPNMKAQKRAIGLFAYYSSWVPKFSDKIHALNHNTIFPLPDKVKQDFENLKTEIEKASVVTIDHETPLVVETDASDIAISATLNQNERPVAFFSRTLNDSEKKHSAVEKEAYAIVESLRKWRHYLLGRHFKLITDQKSVSFMYDRSLKTKIKNDKIQRWRLELSSYSFECVYRPGEENVAADALSRAFCSALTSNKSLLEIHDSLCHPGITRMYHYVKSKNLPYSLEDIKQMTARCATCCEIKPSFFKGQNSPLIKATKPWERLSVDFKGPLPTSSRNRYILTITDEYSRFPFAFPCHDMCSSTIKKCFTELFTTYGLPAFVHSDRGTSFMSSELKEFLHSRGIATSRTTAFNPKGNGQVERLNGTLWRTISLALKSEKLPTALWEKVLPNALHSIRSLLCTATNETPHERFFLFNRRSSTGTTLPQWLSSPGPVLLKRNVRHSKYDPLVDEVELLESNPKYAHVRLPDGRETTVSLHQLAPIGETSTPEVSVPETVLNPDSPPCVIEAPSETPVLPRNLNYESNAQNLSENEVSMENLNEGNLKPTPFIRTRPYNLRSREV